MNLQNKSRIKRIFTASAFVMFCFGVFFSININTVHAVSWYDVSWGYRTKITIDRTKVASSTGTLLSNFPILVSTTTTALKYTGFSGGHVGSTTGSDILFTSSDGTTKLSHEIETYASSTGNLVAWVKLTSLATTTDTDIYMYYGNAGASDQQNISDVWSNGYVGVWHLSDASPTAVDSSGNSNTGTQANGVTFGASGQINSATTYVKASSTYILVPDSDSTDFGTSAFTVSAWAKTTTAVASAMVAKLQGTAPSTRTADYFALLALANGKFEFRLTNQGAPDTSYNADSVASYNDGAWHYVTGVRTDASNSLIYVDNAASVARSGITNVDLTTTGRFSMGAFVYASPDTAVSAIDASIDEVRLSNTTRSADWVLTEYNNQKTPSTFYTSAAEEAVTVPGAPTGLTPTAGNTQVSLTWSAPASDGGSAITDYVIEYKLTATSTWSIFADGTATTTSGTVTGLTNGSSYDFKVYAVNAVGQGSASATASSTPATVPGAPTSPSATAGNTQATVTYTAPASDGGSAILYYTVTSSPGGISTTTATATTTAIVTGLSNGTAYTFTVTASNAVGTSSASSASNSVTPATVPGAPTAVSPTAGNTQVSLTWSAPASDGGSAITDYVIEHKLTSTSTWSTFSDGVSTTTSGIVINLINGSSYDFRISAVNVAGQGSVSSPAVSSTPLTVPDAPTSATAVRGNTQATVTYTAPASNGGSSITSYTITSSPGNISTTTATATTTAIVIGLTNGTAYTFTVTATNAAGTGSSSNASNSVTPATVPDAPTSPSATAGNAQAQITFTPPVSNGGSAITLYTVTSNPGGFTASGGASPITVTGLANGTAYTFTVTATNDVGTSSASSVSNSVTPVTVPGAPTIGTATGGNAQASIIFSAPASDGGSPITGYTMTSSPGGVTGSGTTSPIIVTSLTNGTAYTFTVTATNVVGTSSASSASNSVTPITVPDPPTSLAPTAGNEQVVLSWSAPVVNGGSAITDYVIEYKLTSTSTWSTFSDGVSALTTGTVINLINGSSYDFRVSAVNSAGQGNTSASASAVPVTVPGAPIIGTATAGDAQATVTFTAPVSNGGSAITNYTVTSNPGGITASGGSSPITVTGLTNGVEYTFTVTATNAVGTGTSSSPSNSGTTAGTASSPSPSSGSTGGGSRRYGGVIPASIPNTPTAVSAVGGNTQAIVSFTEPPSNGSAIFLYTAISSPGNNIGTSTGSPISVSGLNNGIKYTFTVTATNALGTSQESLPSNVITLATEPGIPTNIAATIDGSSIALSWSAPALDGGSAITDYIIEYRLTTGGTWAVFSDAMSVQTTALVTGLSNSTEYDFRVSSVNSIGQSSPSNIVSGTPGVPAQVFIRGFSDVTNPSIGTAIRITNEGAESYEYQYRWCVTDTADNVCGKGHDIFSASAAKLIKPEENWDTTLFSTVPNPGKYFFHIFVTYGSKSSSASQSFTAVATFPDQPTSVVAIPGNTQAVISFSTPSSDGGSAITNYTVTSNPGGITASGATSPITVTGLTNGVEYTFTVTATNAVGTGKSSSPPSNPIIPADVPGAVTSLSASAGDTEVGLFWEIPVFDGGVPIIDYVVEYKPSSSNEWSIFAEGVSISNNAKIIGLTNGTSYDFRVGAVNSIGQGHFNFTSADAKSNKNEVSSVPKTASAIVTPINYKPVQVNNSGNNKVAWVISILSAILIISIVMVYYKNIWLKK